MRERGGDVHDLRQHGRHLRRRSLPLRHRARLRRWATLRRRRLRVRCDLVPVWLLQREHLRHPANPRALRHQRSQLLVVHRCGQRLYRRSMPVRLGRGLSLWATVQRGNVRLRRDLVSLRVLQRHHLRQRHFGDPMRRGWGGLPELRSERRPLRRWRVQLRLWRRGVRGRAAVRFGELRVRLDELLGLLQRLSVSGGDLTHGLRNGWRRVSVVSRRPDVPGWSVHRLQLDLLSGWLLPGWCLPAGDAGHSLWSRGSRVHGL